MRKLTFALCLFLGALATVQLVMGPALESSRAALAEEPATGPVPVESNMHEFMEYVFEPPYKRLKAALASPPADKAAWKGIKSDALILAEAGNLLHGRASEGDAPEWNEMSKAVRVAGGQLYAAAKNRESAEARKQWEGMLESCNACHTKFADGEHMLAP